jgi:hypothetical protein
MKPVPYRLEKASAQVVTQQVQSFFNQRYPGTTLTTSQTRVWFDAGSNTVFVQAGPSDQRDIAEIIRQLDTLTSGAVKVELDKVTLTLNIAKSTNVSAIEQAITGNTTVQFVMNDTNDPFTAAHFASPMGVGPVDGTVDFDWGQVGGANVAKMMSGSFKVAMAATPAADFGTKSAEASLTVTFTFTAFE